MSDDRAKQELVVNRVMERMSGFIHGIGMNNRDARQIVERAVAEDPYAPENDIEAKARALMLIALA
jgi:hypothetical protein